MGQNGVGEKPHQPIKLRDLFGPFGWKTPQRQETPETEVTVAALGGAAEPVPVPRTVPQEPGEWFREARWVLGV